MSDPPRTVPFSVQLRLLLGGFRNQFGWLLVGVGLMFVWVFGGTNVLYNLAFFSGELATTEGTISAVVETDITINDQRVYEYEYAYTVDDVSYRGATKGFASKYQENGSVTIEYCVDDQARSRIPRLSTTSIGLLVVVIFPLIGVIFIAFGVRKGLKGGRLLRDGRQAVGVLVSCEATNARVNDQVVYEFTFTFEAGDDKSYEVVTKTHETERFAGEGNLKIDQGKKRTSHAGVQEPILYNPFDPTDAVMLDDLPGGPRIDERGEIRGSGPARIPALIIPGLTVVGHTYWLLRVLEMV